MRHGDKYGLNRFVSAQTGGVFEQALVELQDGEKQGHWMWFIFPQIDGLAQSETAKQYAIKSLNEARQYLAHPILGTRLLECCAALLAMRNRSISAILGYPDDLKLNSSMTLFSQVAGKNSIFSQVINSFFDGNRDQKTLQILEKMRREPS